MTELTPEAETEWRKRAETALLEGDLWTAQKRHDAQRILTLLNALDNERARTIQVEGDYGTLLATHMSVIESRDAANEALSRLLENTGAELAREPSAGFSSVDEYRPIVAHLRTLLAKQWGERT